MTENQNKVQNFLKNPILIKYPSFIHYHFVLLVKHSSIISNTFQKKFNDFMINKNDNLHEVHIEIKLTIPLIRGEKDCKVI